MERKKQVAREVEETVRAFKDDPGPEILPDLYAGIQRKIRALEPRPRRPLRTVLARRVLVPALLVLMLAVNIVMALFVIRVRAGESAAREQGLTALAEDLAAGHSAFQAYLK